MLDRFCMGNNTIDWENMSNASIKMQLEELLHQQKSIKDRMLSLSEKLESVEKEYLLGNNVLIKRYKGED